MVVDIDGLAFQHTLGELEQRHIRAPPRPIDREEAQAGGRQPIQMRVGVRHQLVGLLGGGIQGNRVIDAVGGRERDLVVQPIHGAGGGVN